MPTRILDPSVAVKIAAGEVVERPVSVVKELIDNSIDAGADRIVVETSGGGIQRIKVSDNGSGICADEVILAFSRHATSKIFSMDDLNEIMTLGFRGEALPSIAAVSHVILETKVKEEKTGTRVEIDSGVVIDQRKVGTPTGTAVEVINLFGKLPARLKFLKSNQSENSRISDMVSRYCMAYPEIRFKLVMDGKTVLNCPGNGLLLDAVAAVYGLSIAEHMVPVSGEDGDIRINGLVSRPNISRSNRNYLSLYVNRRFIKNGALNYAIEEAYRGHLIAGRHPVVVANIYLPYSCVDVNVHPAKTEVRFQDERAIFTAVQKAVRSTLTGSAYIPAVEADTGVQYQLEIKNAAGFMSVGERADPDYANCSTSDWQTMSGSRIPILRTLGQIAGCYIVAEGPDGMYLIDQHAAHERILYEKIKGERLNRGIEVQQLLDLVTVELSPQQQNALASRNEYLSGYGFEIEPFGNRTYVLRSVPAQIAGKDVVESVLAVIDSLRDNVDDWDDEIAISLACHGAIKSGQRLSFDEMKELVGQLEQTALPLNCPHGRPTLIRLSRSQLEKEFKRR